MAAVRELSDSEGEAPPISTRCPSHGSASTSSRSCSHYATPGQQKDPNSTRAVSSRCPQSRLASSSQINAVTQLSDDDESDKDDDNTSSNPKVARPTKLVKQPLLATRCPAKRQVTEQDVDAPLRGTQMQSLDVAELFAGSGNLTKAMAAARLTAEGYDVLFGPHNDLLEAGFYRKLLYMIENCPPKYFHFAPPCATYSIARHPKIRYTHRYM